MVGSIALIQVKRVVRKAGLAFTGKRARNAPPLVPVIPKDPHGNLPIPSSDSLGSVPWPLDPPSSELRHRIIIYEDARPSQKGSGEQGIRVGPCSAQRAAAT